MRTSQRMRRREHKLIGLYESVQATALTLDLSEVLNRLAEATARALRCKGAAIRLLDKSGSYLEMAAACGLSEAYVDKGLVDVARSRIDQEALSGRPDRGARCGGGAAPAIPGEGGRGRDPLDSHRASDRQARAGRRAAGL